MSQDLSPNPEQQEEQEAVDPIVLLGQELQQIREALGLGKSPASSSLMQRLDTIEQKLSKPQEQRNLPESITRAQASDPNFLRRAGISLADFTSDRVKIRG
jgi:hypothetical protein